MEAYGDAFRQAKDKVKVADYSVSKVFPMTKDPQVLRSCLTNLHEAQVRALDALLLFERTYKRVPAYPVGHLETKLRLFGDYCAKRYNLQEDMIDHIRSVKELATLAAAQAPSLSGDGRRLIFREDGFQVKAVPFSDVKIMISRASAFVESIGKVVQHDGSH